MALSEKYNRRHCRKKQDPAPTLHVNAMAREPKCTRPPEWEKGTWGRWTSNWRRFLDGTGHFLHYDTFEDGEGKLRKSPCAAVDRMSRGRDGGPGMNSPDLW